jgi:hypothetical protein
VSHGDLVTNRAAGVEQRKQAGFTSTADFADLKFNGMKNSPDNEKVSPLKEKPLRLPGQSGDEMLDKKRDKLDEYFLMVMAAFAIAFWEWWHHWLKVPPQPWPATVLLIIVILLAVKKTYQYRTEAKNIKQGRDGERIVAEQLEKLRVHGYRILHDLVAGNFNVDHVIVGPAGIFAVETKTPSKVGRGNRIEFDGEHIFINGKRFAPNPIQQAEANAKWIYGILKSSAGKSFWVTPIVTFPDWSVLVKKRESDLLVLNHKQIEGALTNRKTTLNDEEVSMATFHLERFVRSGQKKN